MLVLMSFLGSLERVFLRAWLRAWFRVFGFRVEGFRFRVD